jgi:hypothetical protein
LVNNFIESKFKNKMTADMESRVVDAYFHSFTSFLTLRLLLSLQEKFNRYILAGSVG